MNLVQAANALKKATRVRNSHNPSRLVSLEHTNSPFIPIIMRGGSAS